MADLDLASGARKARIREAKLRFDLRKFPAAGALHDYSKSTTAHENSKYLDRLLISKPDPEPEPVAKPAKKPRKFSKPYHLFQKRP